MHIPDEERAWRAGQGGAGQGSAHDEHAPLLVYVIPLYNSMRVQSIRDHCVWAGGCRHACKVHVIGGPTVAANRV